MKNYRYICVDQMNVSMEVVLKSNNEKKIAKILALAEKLNVIIEKRDSIVDQNDKEAIKHRILNFKNSTLSSFGDPADWEREQREERDLPFKSI